MANLLPLVLWILTTLGYIRVVIAPNPAPQAPPLPPRRPIIPPGLPRKQKPGMPPGQLRKLSDGDMGHIFNHLDNHDKNVFSLVCKGCNEQRHRVQPKKDHGKDGFEKELARAAEKSKRRRENCENISYRPRSNFAPGVRKNMPKDRRTNPDYYHRAFEGTFDGLVKEYSQTNGDLGRNKNPRKPDSSFKLG